ncbi:MAG: TonB-dependent receptor [Tannerellaceae bacterium]
MQMQAQVTTASISGKITDQQNEPLPGAAITAVHQPTGTVYNTVSQMNGSYNLPNMRIGGPYLLEATYVGFHKYTQPNISLELGEERNMNIRMRENSQALDEIVVVADKNPLISGNRTGAQEIITREKMDKLPTINRSLSDFTKLTPMSSGGNFGGVSYRFNNITVDGASFNNSFGLSSSLGAAGTEPISLEAIEQVQVMIAPYDVRNGGFTGAGINSVTKSGTNEYHASAYMYTKSPSMMGYRVKDEVLPVAEFANHQYGVSLSGPIIKNKLFFFINGEMDRQETPISYTTANSAVKASDLQDLSNFVQDKLGYNPGAFDVDKANVQADRITARLDWNINQKNELSVKYYYLKSFNSNSPSSSGAPTNGRGPNEYAIPFSSCFYRTNNNFNIFMADLNTTINSRMSNYLKVGYSRLRDYRDMDGGYFPQVDILNGDNQAYTTFGTEANSYNNQLNTDIWQIQDNFVMNFGKHQITIGTQSDYRTFQNGFAQNYPGSWVFNSIDDFKFNVEATQDYMKAHGGSIQGFDIRKFDPTSYGYKAGTTGITNSASTGYKYYAQKYAIGNDFPFAEVSVLQLGFYAQDKWTLSDKLSLTLGLRIDIPIFMTDLAKNPNVEAETYRDGIRIDVSKYPNTKPRFSPRLGFNYRPFEDASLQVRGGTGIFSGTPPYVWLSNQAGNNGILFGDLNYSKEDEKASLGFTGDLNTYKPAEGAPTRSDIAVTDPNFKYPTLWKSNLAVDYKFGDGWVATVEMLHSKDLNGIYHDNIGIYNTDKIVNDGSPMGGRRFFDGYYSNQPGNKKAANHVILLRNTDKGHSFYTTFQLQKNFMSGILKGLYLNGSYTLGRAKAVTDGSSSVATSAWKYRASLNPNDQELSYSSGSFDGRLLLSASYTANWSKYTSTNFGLIYQRYQPFRYSYCYNGDANGDSQSSNDLMYIPRDFNDVKDNLLPGKFKTQQDAWVAMDAFIAQDPYLSEHRGEYAERNGATVPYANQLDLSVSHDFNLYQKNGRKHTLRLSFNIANFLNLLSKNWGVQETTVLGRQQYQFLTVKEKPSAKNNYLMKYEMRPDLNETFQDDKDKASRWQMQFGVKYIF